jgi:hypothetical protein
VGLAGLGVALLVSGWLLIRAGRIRRRSELVAE